MKVRFKTEELRLLYEVNPNEIKGKQKFSKEVVKQYQAKVNILIAISALNELLAFRSLNFEKLKGNRSGEMSIRLNKQFRLIFQEIEDNLVQLEVIEISKHYE